MKSKVTDRDSFFNEVYAVVAEIPRGSVLTYGDIALLLGYPQHSRMVGRALRSVPEELSLPCHRVVNANGRIAPGWPEQRQLLLEESVGFKDNGEVNLKKYKWNWREL